MQKPVCLFTLTLVGTLAIGRILEDSVLQAQVLSPDSYFAIPSSGQPIADRPSPEGTASLLTQSDESFHLGALDSPDGWLATETYPVLPAAYPSPRSEFGKVGGSSMTEESPLSQTQQRRASNRGSQERLIDRVTDPTAWLMEFRFREQWNWPLGDSNSDSEQFEFRPTIPFVAWDQVNLLRVTIPYKVRDSDGAGLGDVEIFDLVVFDATWGRWGVGPLVRFNADSAADSNTLEIGPVAGAVSKNKHWTIGFLTQNYFSDAVAESRLQPILAYKFDERWALSAGETQFRYDWDEARWTQLPLGLQLDRVADICGQKVKLFVNPQYNFQSGASNSGWTVFVGLTLLATEH